MADAPIILNETETRAILPIHGEGNREAVEGGVRRHFVLTPPSVGFAATSPLMGRI
jgi:hypothetical protein